MCHPEGRATGTAICSLGQMTTGATATITIVVKPTVKRGTITNSAAVSGNGSTTDPVSANDLARPPST